MELYNLPNVALPTLTINKIHERQKIEDDPNVINFIQSKLLLDQEFNKLYVDISEKSKEVLHIMGLSEDELLREFMLHRSRGYPTRRKLRQRQSGVHQMMLYRNMLHHYHSGSKNDKELEKQILEAKKAVYADVRKEITKLSDTIQNKLSDFQEKRNVELPILSSTTVHACKKCAKIISLNTFKRCNCICGEKVANISQIKQAPIHHFNDRLTSFIEKNYWLEHGVDYLLRRKNFDTLVGCNVLGHSGVWHEIDNIATYRKDNYRFFCECKNSDVKVGDVFVFSGKMIDVGCTRGYIFTTSENVSDEIERLARSKNIDIIKGVLARDIKAVLGNIKEG